MEEQATPDMDKTVGLRIRLIFLILLFTAIIIGGIIFAGGGIINSITALKESRITASINYWDFPIFFVYPANIALIVIFFLRLFDLETQKRMNACMKVIAFSVIIFLAVRIPYGFIASSYMTSQGYSYCYDFTSAGARSDDVWVRDPAYCIDDAGVIRIELLEWLNETQDAGQDPTPQEVRIKAEELFKADSVKKFRY